MRLTFLETSDTWNISMACDYLNSTKNIGIKLQLDVILYTLPFHYEEYRGKK